MTISMAYSLVGLFFASKLLLVPGLSHGATSEEKLRVSVAAVTGSHRNEFVAIEKGYHRAGGLTVELIRTAARRCPKIFRL